MRRVVVGALFVEIVPVAILSALTAWLGPRDQDAAIAFAASAARWTVLVTGPIVAFVVGWLVARKVRRDQLWHGLLVGVLAAALEVAIMIVAIAPMDAPFVIGTVGKVLMATAGGAIVRPGPA